MEQGDLFMPTPMVPRRSLAKRCRADGQQQGRISGDLIWAQMFAAYKIHGPQTDAELARRLGIERTTVNARRNEHPEVIAVGVRKNERSGVNNTVWGLR